MSSQNEQLEPTPFELAPQAHAEETTTKSPPGWVLPALGGLAVLAVLVIFWLPRQVSAPAQAPAQPDQPDQPAATDATPGKTAKEQVAAGPQNSPWSDAQAAKLRKEAQDILQQLLDLQFALDERGAQQWATETYAEAVATAQAGDELYRQREYVEAKEKYQLGLEQMQAINASIPSVVDQQLALVREGLELGLPEQVEAALALATLIEPENAALPELQQRAAVMEPLMALMAEAVEAEASNDLGTAKEKLGSAVELDPLHQRAASELQRVAAALLDQQFNDAMSDGYVALDEDRYSSARESFNRAASLRPGSSEASSALQEVTVAQQSSKLTRLKREGDSLEQSEQWQKAVEAYQSALETDASLLFAVEGLKRSQSRARVDKQFRAAMLQPERLNDIAVAEATEKLLQQAKKIDPQGPILKEQIATLEVLLKQANTLVPVTLRSDGETEVIVYKVARLGKFQERELTLRPGTYQVRGSRVGYRDVLHKFTVSHSGDFPPLAVTCTERIL